MLLDVYAYTQPSTNISTCILGSPTPILRVLVLVVSVCRILIVVSGLSLGPPLSYVVLLHYKNTIKDL